MNHSKLFDKIKSWYEAGKWPRSYVYNVVAKGTITPEEYEEITGEAYATDNDEA